MHLCESFRTIPFSYCFDKYMLSYPVWGQMAAPQLIQGAHWLWRFITLGQRCPSCLSFLLWMVFSCLPGAQRRAGALHHLPGSCWSSDALHPGGRGSAWSPPHPSSWSLIQRGGLLGSWDTLRGLLSLKHWNRLYHFISERTFYFSYLTFPCKLKWENHSPDRLAQGIIKNTLQEAGWQYPH